MKSTLSKNKIIAMANVAPYTIKKKKRFLMARVKSHPSFFINEKNDNLFAPMKTESRTSKAIAEQPTTNIIKNENVENLIAPRVIKKITDPFQRIQPKEIQKFKFKQKKTIQPEEKINITPEKKINISSEQREKVVHRNSDNLNDYSNKSSEFENKIEFYQEENLRLSHQLVQQKKSKEISSARLQEIEEVQQIITSKFQEIGMLLASISNISVLNSDTPEVLISDTSEDEKNIFENNRNSREEFVPFKKTEAEHEVSKYKASKNIDKILDIEVRSIFSRK